MFRQAIKLDPNSYPPLGTWEHFSGDIVMAILLDIAEISENYQILDARQLYKKSFIDDFNFHRLIDLNSTWKGLYLSGCPISPGIFEAISERLGNSLKFLDVSGIHNLTDEAIVHLRCFKLVKLNLSQCFNLTEESVTKILQDCPDLEDFDISFLTLNNSTPLVEDFKLKLKSFNLNHCSIKNLNVVVETISKFPNLEKLHLQSLPIKDEHVKLISTSCTRLSDVNLTGCTSLTDQSISALSTCFNLKTAWLTSLPYISSNSLLHLARSCFQLETLGLSGTKMNLAENLGILGKNCPRLHKLVLDASRLDDDGLNYMSGNFFNLKTLNLGNCNISDAALTRVISTCPEITELNLYDCSHVTDASCRNFSENLFNLETIVLYRCPISDLGLSHLSHCFNLKSIDLTGTNVTDTGIGMLVEGCSKITDLRLWNCRISDLAIQHVSGLHQLRVLDLRNCLIVQDLSPLEIGCPKLERLLLAGCEYVGDNSLKGLERFYSLKMLDLMGCHRITDITMQRIEDGAPSLSTLILGSNKISNSAVENLKISRPFLEIMSQHNNSTSQPKKAPQKRNAIKSLMSDLKQIRDDPLPLVSAQPLHDDMFTWHANLVGPENTPYAQGIFHIQLNFPKNYPNAGPSATILCDLPHPHVHNGKICLDLLSDFRSYFEDPTLTEKHDKSVGWSSAYSVQTILLQLQAFLLQLDDEDEVTVEKYLPKIPKAVENSKNFKCSHCPHQPGAPWPAINSVESIPRSFVSEDERLKEELICYHTRSSFEEDTLGIGISIKRNARGAIVEILSPMELLSYTAYRDGVRTSIMKDVSFTHWLPLYLNKEHAKSAGDLYKISLSEISTGFPDRFQPSQALEVFGNLMNTMIVKLMKGELHASLRSLQGYIYIQRLLLMFVNEYPELMDLANRRVDDFVNSENNRTKQAIPALGVFLPLLLVSRKSWRDIQDVYLREHFDRNVFWIIKDNPDLAKSDYDQEVDATRNIRTFEITHVSLKLLAFHIYFLNRIGRPPDMSLDDICDRYDQLYGNPTAQMKDQFQDAVKEILEIDSWEEFFTRVGARIITDKELNIWLRQSVINSGMKEYHHIPGNRRNLARSGGKRQEICKRFQRGDCPYGSKCQYLHRRN
eukprot:TRINITY_DN3432_c0_g1_i1.p1 TRINITY_DN3432_c0_g1~~TRINITY_DN3432_c0_g1_i1.p1  ORF type:complete len:1126 (+),score=389.91 TRINITY_DN3432_c0_g1_i1:135-3512(+)